MFGNINTSGLIQVVDGAPSAQISRQPLTLIVIVAGSFSPGPAGGLFLGMEWGGFAPYHASKPQPEIDPDLLRLRPPRDSVVEHSDLLLSTP